MPDFLMPTAVIVLGSPVIAAYFLAVAAFLPQRVARTRTTAEASPGRSFVVGLVNLVFFSTLSLALFSLNERGGGGLLAIPALAVTALLAIGVSLGLAGVVQLMGERLAPSRGTLGRGVVGGLVLALAGAAPLAGWLLVLPYAAMLGLGALMLSFLYAPKAKPEAAAAMP